MTDIFAVKISGTMEAALCDKYLKLLTPEKQAKIRRFLKWEDMQRSLVAEILLKVVIIEKLKIDNKKIEITVDKYGKPFLKGNLSFSFNISHSGEWVVCATDEYDVGIDVEEVRLIQTEDIIQNYFSREECRYFQDKGDIEKLDLFYKLWTLKESYIKAIGTGFSTDFTAFTIVFGKPVRVRSDVLEPWFLKQYEFDVGYKLSLCTRYIDFPPEIIFISMEELRFKAEKYLL
ncbi:MAG: 4'-phosphopantetheinyl transferase superfamily protein [Anaerocolumna sp.]